jgi:biopolymer transport protein ExbD
MMGRRNQEEVDTELNLVPIMNLFTALIPFLLLSAAFVQVKVINGSVPAIADGSDPVNEEKAYDKRPVVVNVQVDDKGYHGSANGDDVDPSEPEAFKVTLERGSKGYDAIALTKHLAAIKQRHPKSDTIIIVPTEKLKYEEVVRVMDASREVPQRPGAPPVPDHMKYLFPKVVVASLVQ